MPGSPDTVSTVRSAAHTLPPSPVTSVSYHEDEPVIVSALDDIFGSSPSDGAHGAFLERDITPLHRISIDADITDGAATPTATASASARNSAQAQGIASAHEPSDLPSVRRQHVTNGYRSGITLAKQEHLQRGFDEGYPFGAKLGLRAGIIKGVLEGLMRSNIDDPRFRRAVIDLKQRAEVDLEVSKVFAKAAAAVAPGAGDATAAASAASAGDAAQEPLPPHLVLNGIGDRVIFEWENKINNLLAQTTGANVGENQRQG
ncbi:Essential protein Yae1, N terminal [Ascosphaera pollenicola]|nr:Essential protein Yae1, N terminal [Ascosphaera pollenicola]